MSAADEQVPEVVEGEVVDLDALLDPRPLQYPPAVREVCACGKDGRAFAHGLMPGRERAFTCAEVLEIAARVEAAQTPRRRRLRGLFRRGGA